MKQLPEFERIEEQVVLLQKWLSGNESFARLRGTMETEMNPFDFMLGKGGVNSSPTSKKKEWKQFSSDWNIVGNMLAKLARDGNQFAFNEIKDALEQKKRIISGEYVSFSKKKAMTVIMFNPKFSFPSLRFLGPLQGKSRKSLRKYNNFHDEIIFVMRGEETYDPYHQKLLKKLKSINDFKTAHSASPGNALIGSYFADIIKPEVGHLSMEQRDSLFSKPLFFWHENNIYIDDTSRGYWPKNGIGFAWIFDGTQKEVLSLLGRKANVATWQINVPEISVKDNENIKIGFHPEAEHDNWKKIRPSLCSESVNNGYGIVVSPEEEYLDSSTNLLKRRFTFQTKRTPYQGGRG